MSNDKKKKDFPTALIMLSIFLSMIVTMGFGWYLADTYGGVSNIGIAMHSTARPILVGPI